MDVIQLATLARGAELSDYTIRTIRMLAEPDTRNAKLPSDLRTTWDGTLRPAWEIQMLGQVRTAVRNANAFIDFWTSVDVPLTIE
jgi:hypothetical protein